MGRVGEGSVVVYDGWLHAKVGKRGGDGGGVDDIKKFGRSCRWK